MQEQHTPAVLTLRAITPKGHITALVNLGIMETDGTAKVNFRILLNQLLFVLQMIIIRTFWHPNVKKKNKHDERFRGAVAIFAKTF